MRIYFYEEHTVSAGKIVGTLNDEDAAYLDSIEDEDERCREQEMLGLRATGNEVCECDGTPNELVERAKARLNTRYDTRSAGMGDAFDHAVANNIIRFLE